MKLTVNIPDNATVCDIIEQIRDEIYHLDVDYVQYDIESRVKLADDLAVINKYTTD